MVTLRESLAVEPLGEMLLRIRHENVMDGGFGSEVDMSGTLIMHRGYARWLADLLDRGADDELPETEGQFTPDRLKVYVSGGQRVPDDYYVNILNHRDESAIHGGVQSTTLSPERARELATKLRAFADQNLPS